MPFKIATWNINSVRLRIGLVEQFLEEHQPDVLCLQEINGRKLQIHNFYVPAGGDEADIVKNPKFDHKLKFLTEMLELPHDHSGVENILVGDLNIAPHENDVWSHKKLLKVVSHTPIETEFLDRIRDEGGWSDLVRQKISSDEVIYSWWSYRAKDWDSADKGRRLDHIWGSPSLNENLTNISILREARGWEKPFFVMRLQARDIH